MRKKPNLIPRMERCAALLVTEPETLRGRWRETFPAFKEIRLELGCGKGRFTAEQAKTEPEVLLLALEKVPDAMVVAMERAMAGNIPNVRFLDRDAGLLPEIFAPGEISRLYINFCDPWPKSRDAKLRLTAPGFLRLYAELLPVGGAIHFKTDNAPLFEWSIRQLTDEGWALDGVTRDLHADGPVGVMTDYEAKFYDQGVKINRLEATRTADTKTTAAGPVPRLRNASLTDARGFAESAENAG
ncbi:MAG: tRNA (guanosine(46)-N7)-methyltransferase TrmB [Oscillospiraceae bacterium]|nr:tRNA (guanosine(46)-N7)-methyltransferase TrmB [Oscillospiraceae bacterium]